MKKIFICCAALLTMAFAACSDDNNTVNNPTPPSFEIVESDEETSDGAWLYAEYDYEGQGTITGAGFAYKIRQSQDEYTKVASDEWDQNGVYVQLTGLQPDTEYMCYCYVLIGDKQHNSLAMTFTTAAEGEDPAKPKPVFQKPASGDYTQTSASVSCAYTYKGDAKIDETGFFYKKAGDTAYNKVKAAGTTSPIACELTGLTAGTVYNYYAYLIVGGETYNSAGQTFSTKTEQGEVTPVFGTPTSYSVTTNTAGIACSFSYNDDVSKITEVSFRYRTASAADYTKVTLSAAPGDKSTSLSGLTPGTAYVFHLYTVIGGKTYQSAEATFTTQSQQGGGPSAKYAGWAELPAEKVKSGDYYYAYHITDVNGSNGQKARNYGVCYSNERKCAIWVAAPMHPFYSKKNTNRTDAYKTDPDIPVSQPGKWTGYTRGHMLGSAERLVSNNTNRQVFYHSNIAPQLQTYFNTGGGAWNTLEDWVDTQWEGSSDTTYQVIGCYWDPAKSPKKVSGTTIPTHFYKILLRTKGHKNKWVVNCTRDELQCVAIMVEHRTYSKNEVPKPSQYQSKGMLYSVKQIEEMTGMTFFPNVPNAPKDTYNTSDWGF